MVELHKPDERDAKIALLEQERRRQTKSLAELQSLERKFATQEVAPVSPVPPVTQAQRGPEGPAARNPEGRYRNGPEYRTPLDHVGIGLKDLMEDCQSAELIPGIALFDRPEHRFFEFLQPHVLRISYGF